MELQKMRDARNGVTERNGVKTENVVKMFADPDKVAAIKASVALVTIGNPPTQVIIKPLNPRLGIEAYQVLRSTLLPIVDLYRKQQSGTVNIVDVFDAFGENVTKIPRLLYLILSRGNTQITEEWVDEHLDLVPDTLTILPHFMEQNMFNLLFSPKARAPQQPPQQPQEKSASKAEDPEPANTEPSTEE